MFVEFGDDLYEGLLRARKKLMAEGSSSDCYLNKQMHTTNPNKNIPNSLSAIYVD